MQISLNENLKTEIKALSYYKILIEFLPPGTIFRWLYNKHIFTKAEVIFRGCCVIDLEND